jgi:hypothetical protein
LNASVSTKITEKKRGKKRSGFPGIKMVGKKQQKAALVEDKEDA